MLTKLLPTNFGTLVTAPKSKRKLSKVLYKTLYLLSLILTLRVQKIKQFQFLVEIEMIHVSQQIILFCLSLKKATCLIVAIFNMWYEEQPLNKLYIVVPVSCSSHCTTPKREHRTRPLLEHITRKEKLKPVARRLAGMAEKLKMSNRNL